MDIMFFRFDVCGEMDYRRYELTIGVYEKPIVLEQTGVFGGYYRDQVEFHLFEPEGSDDEPGHSIMVTIHQAINPGYDLAVRQLIGDELADIIQDHGHIDAQLERDRIMSERGEASTESVLQAFLNNRIDETKASEILGRILVNSTFA
jgi:hypothetical protein